MSLTTSIAVLSTTVTVGAVQSASQAFNGAVMASPVALREFANRTVDYLFSIPMVGTTVSAVTAPVVAPSMTWS